MGVPWRASIFKLRYFRQIWPWVLLLSVLGLIRWSKGVVFLDIYSSLTRPFWPGPAQKEWVQSGHQFEQKIRLKLLDEDNNRLRGMLELAQASSESVISAAVISRSPKGWWQQIELGKGQLNGIRPGQAVVGPGGLLGMIASATPLTARVRLLTSPGSRIGVWIPRIKRHGMLIGMGTNRPQLRFLDKDPQALPGDVVSTSPASTLLPPNLSIGVIQYIDSKALPAPVASVQLLAAPEAIDWVQVYKF